MVFRLFIGISLLLVNFAWAEAPNPFVERRVFAVSRNFVNGSFQESFNALVIERSGAVIMTLEQSGGGDLTMQFSDGDTTLDCTATGTTSGLCEATFTAGSDTSPTANYIYITKANKILEKSTSAWPSEEHNKIGYFLIPSAGFVQTNGVYINQNWNDFMSGTNSQGHMLHMTERERRSQAQYFSGINPNGDASTYLVNTAGNTELKSTSGVIYQLHEHAFEAFDTSSGDVVLVKNWAGVEGVFHDITNLYDITTDSTNATIGNNKYFNLVIWGVGNKTGEYSPLLINLPGGFYNTQAAAEEDVSGHDDFSMSREFNLESSTGFLIARITIQMKTGGGTWVTVSTTDLRGQTPNTASGGVGSIVTEFADNAFIIFDESNNTKEVAFDVGTNVTTGNTRTITIADRDLDLADPVFDSTVIDNLTLNGMTITSTSELSLVSTNIFRHTASPADTDIALVFNTSGTPGSNGQFNWMEDEDYFKYIDDIFMDTDETIQIGDADDITSPSAYLSVGASQDGKFYSLAAGTTYLDSTISDADFFLRANDGGTMKDFLVIDASEELLTLGRVGDIELGDGTLRDMFPNTHAKINFGTDAKSVNNIFMVGDLDIENGDIILDTTTGTKIGTATSQKLGFYNATPVNQPNALTTDLTDITHTAPGTPDFALQDLIDSGVGSAFGFATKDEGNTLLSVVLNLQTRVDELEDRMQELGLLP